MKPEATGRDGGDRSFVCLRRECRSTIRPHVETGLANLFPDAQDPPQCHEGAEPVVSASNPRDPGLETLVLCIRGPCGKMKLSVSKRISGGFRMQAGWSSRHRHLRRLGRSYRRAHEPSLGVSDPMESVVSPRTSGEIRELEAMAKPSRQPCALVMTY